MKTKSGKMSRSMLSVLLAVCLLVSCLTVAIIPTDAAKSESESVGGGTNWNANIFFRVPDGWDLSTYSHVQAWAVQSTSANSGTKYAFLLGTMSIVGTTSNSRLYHAWVSANHSSWGSTEYIAFTANTSNWGTGDFYISTSGQYTKPLSYGATNSSGAYLFTPSDATNNTTSNNNTMSGSHNGTNRDVLKKNQDFYVCTGSSSGATGGKIDVTAHYVNGSSFSGSSAIASSTITVDSNDSGAHEQYSGAVEGTKVTMTATANSGYVFDGWYSNSNCTTKISSDASYSYNVFGAKSVYANFKRNTYTVTYSLGSNVTKGTITGGTDNGSGTITADHGNTVVFNVSYATGYEYDSAQSSISGATVSNNGTTFTYSNITANKTLTIRAKSSAFNVTVQAGSGGTVSAQAGSVGTVSGTTFNNLLPGYGGTITATPNTQNNYVFSGWTASPAANITFADAGSATTTFEASGAATITANFTQETLYPVTVKLDGLTETTVNAGATINPELTRADRSDSDYDFTGWTLSGNVQLASGYTTSDTTIKIKATGTGGRVTANYTHVDYIYFYAALQSNWGSNPVVTVDGANVGAYAWMSSYAASNTPINLYSNSTGSQIGGNSVYTYYVGIYRVPVAKAGKNISVFNSTQTGTDTNKGYCGTVQNDQGRCYYTYSTSVDNNTSGSIAPQKVNTVTISPTQNFYDRDNTITIGKTETMYYGSTTAGHDSFTYTFKLVNTSTSAEKTLASDLASSTSTYQFVPQDKSVAAGTWKAVVVTKDSKTGRIINSCESSSFTIQNTPTSSTVTYSATNSTVSGSYKYYTNTATSFNSGASLRAGSTVTLVYTISDGYTYNASANPVSATGVTPTVSYNSSTNKLTVTFTVPSGGTAITISYTATEITHTVTIKRRYYNSDGSTLMSTDSSAYATITGVGKYTAKSTGAAPSVTDYTFKTFVLPTGVTLSSGSLTTTDAISVTATVDNATIYINYWETVYNITIQNDGHGNVQRNSTNITSGSTTKIGNVTAVSLSAVAASGYDFKEWVVTKGSGTATKVYVNGTAYTLGSSITFTLAQAGSTSTFRFNGTATLRANFKPVDYSISASFPANNGYTLNSATGNNVSTSVGSGQIGDAFTINVILADGYEVASIAGTGITSTMPTPTVSGRTYSYGYTLGASNVVATVTLRAKTPTLSGVQIKNTTFDYISPADNATVTHYYKQPDMVKAITDSFSTITYTNGTNSEADKASGVEVSLNPNYTTSLPDTVDGTKTYTLTVTATNQKPGVETKTTEKTYTIRVSFNNTQKVYFNQKLILSKCIREAASNNSYYTADAPITAYNTAFDASSHFIDPDYNYPTSTTYSPQNSDYPAYNASTTDYNNANALYTTFLNAYDALMLKANLSTVYVLTQYSNNSSTPINLTMTTNGTLADWNHFKMYQYRAGSASRQSDAVHHMTYYGNVAKNGTTYYLYRYTFAGRAYMQVWHGTSATGTSLTQKLTNVIQTVTDNGSSTAMAIGGNYYINVYNITNGNGTSTTCKPWTDFGHTKNSGKQYVEMNETQTQAQIQTKFNFTPAGAVVSDPGITTTCTAFTITGPIGKASSTTYNLLAGQTFPASAQGKYTVSYTTCFGYEAAGNDHPIVRTETATLWVAFDDITIYVDMNENVGNPILNFRYWVKNEVPVAAGTSGASPAYLPYEMDLMTGSESVYKYTIKISKLTSDYKLTFANGSPIKINYINVEGNYINANGKFTSRPTTDIDTGAFQIGIDARITGEIWFKANSTNLTTFNSISYGAVTKSFVAVAQDGHNTVISSAVSRLHGTGVNTDDDEIYHNRYASLYTLDNASAPVSNFRYVLNAAVKEEITIGNNTYYFDKWQKMQTPADGLETDTNGYLTASISSATDYSDAASLNFTAASDYNNGEGDYTYIALYKIAQTGDSTVRVEVTYEFEDYNTSDGNYIYDQYKDTITESYTKTIKVNVGSGQTYANFNAVNNVSALNTICAANVPYVVSNYFNYAYTANSAVIDNSGTDSAQSKIKVTAQLTETARTYTIIVKDGSTVVTTKTGNYQQTADLTTTKTNPVWKDSNDQILATGATYKARFVSSGNESNNGTDCQIIKVASQSGATSAGRSVIADSFTEVYYTDKGTEMLRHNFYIIDYCAEGKLIGGGALYATGTYSSNTWSYRQANATANLDTAAHRQSFITGILGSDYSIAYEAQTINNVGFYYRPFKSTEDVFRYSDELSAYHTMIKGTNVNSESYNNQKLRVFSFMVYDNSGTTVIVPSDGFAEVDRYQPQG